jgi:hypothetical protein
MVTVARVHARRRCRVSQEARKGVGEAPRQRGQEGGGAARRRLPESGGGDDLWRTAAASTRQHTGEGDRKREEDQRKCRLTLQLNLSTAEAEGERRRRNRRRTTTPVAEKRRRGERFGTPGFNSFCQGPEEVEAVPAVVADRRGRNWCDGAMVRCSRWRSVVERKKNRGERKS